MQLCFWVYLGFMLLNMVFSVALTLAERDATLNIIYTFLWGGLAMLVLLWGGV